MFGLKARQLVYLLILLILVLAAWQIVPVYFQRFQFTDFVGAEVKFAVSKRANVKKVRSNILDEARRAQIPITAADVHITRRGPTFTVEIDYKLPVDLGVYQFQWPSHVKIAGDIFDDDRH